MNASFIFNIIAIVCILIAAVLMWCGDQKQHTHSFNPYRHQLMDGSINWDAGRYFYDENNYQYRPYNSINEVYSYLSEAWRKKVEKVYISEGGKIVEYYFNNGKLTR